MKAIGGSTSLIMDFRFFYERGRSVCVVLSLCTYIYTLYIYTDVLTHALFQ